MRGAPHVRGGEPNATAFLDQSQECSPRRGGEPGRGTNAYDLFAVLPTCVGEKSDLFDVLAHVAYALAPLTREERATNAKGAITSHFNSKQQAFLDFVLSQYVKVGVHELDKEKLSPLLNLKYHTIADAMADLGKPEEIGKVFADFQKFLYVSAA
ncbi:MAG: hypothetical protein EXR98_06845 [Gemmataceae bacterium]|nr:hypothetical protein [Gemmataceae bacterium]